MTGTPQDDRRADRLWALLTAEVREAQALREQMQAKEKRACELAAELRQLTASHQQEVQHA